MRRGRNEMELLERVRGRVRGKRVREMRGEEGHYMGERNEWEERAKKEGKFMVRGKDEEGEEEEKEGKGANEREALRGESYGEGNRVRRMRGKM